MAADRGWSSSGLGSRMKIKALLILALSMLTVAGEARAREFGGHDCSDDCSGHAAGYRWAEAQGITDERIARCGVVLFLFMKVASCTSRIRTVAPTRMMPGMTSTDFYNHKRLRAGRLAREARLKSERKIGARRKIENVEC